MHRSPCRTSSFFSFYFGILKPVMSHSGFSCQNNINTNQLCEGWEVRRAHRVSFTCAHLVTFLHGEVKGQGHAGLKCIVCLEACSFGSEKLADV